MVQSLLYSARTFLLCQTHAFLAKLSIPNGYPLYPGMFSEYSKLETRITTVKLPTFLSVLPKSLDNGDGEWKDDVEGQQCIQGPGLLASNNLIRRRTCFNSFQKL